MSKKVTAYQVNNLTKVNLKHYQEGDLFITNRTLGILMNGEIVPIPTKQDLKKIENQLKKLGEKK